MRKCNSASSYMNQEVVISSLSKSFVRDRFTWLAYLMLGYYSYVLATLGPLMPFLRRELRLSYTVGALHFSALALGVVLAGTVGDRIVRRWGRRFAFWSGSAGVALSALSLTLSSWTGLTIASAGLMGFLGSLMSQTVNAALADQYAERRAMALTEANIAASLCASLAPACVSVFQRLGIGWRGALLLAVLMLVVLAVGFRSALVPKPQVSLNGSAAADRKLPIAYWAYWAVILLSVSSEWSIVFWSADFLEHVVGLRRTDASATVSVFLLAMVIGRVIGRRLTRVVPIRKLLLLAIGISLIGFMLFWLAPLAALNIAGLFVAGLGIANLYPLTLSSAISVAPGQSGMASARVALGSGTALLTAPLLLGWLADQITIYNAYGIVAVLLVLATAMILIANRLALQKTWSAGYNLPEITRG
jgi:MFS family permease